MSTEILDRRTSLNCPHCILVNSVENKYCSKCFYPLAPSAFEEIKLAKIRKINELKEKYEGEMKNFRQEDDEKIKSILLLTFQKNPQLTQIKVPVLEKKLELCKECDYFW